MVQKVRKQQMSEIIDLEAVRYLKKSGDEFLEFAENIEKYFRYRKTGELILKRILYSLKYVFNVCDLAILEEKDAQKKQDYTDFVVSFLKQMLDILESEE